MLSGNDHALIWINLTLLSMANVETAFRRRPS